MFFPCNSISSDKVEDYPQRLRVVVFFSPGCEGCYEVKDVALPHIADTFKEHLVIEYRDINDIEAYKELLEYEKYYSSTENEPLKVFVGSKSLAGTEEILSKLEDTVAEELAKGSRTFNVTPETASPEGPASSGGGLPENIKERFRTFSPLAVAGAGLLDGINPCVFTVIVFFISLLAYLGKSRRQMLIVGFGFSISVFATYLLLGLGVTEAVNIFSVSHGISRGITIVTALFALSVAGLSFLDYIRYRRSGDVKDMKLGLPQSIKNRIHKIMRHELKASNLLIGSIVIGFLVSLLESVCTGQLYVPTIVFVLRDPKLRPTAFGYLLLYNLMFIIPLVMVFAVAYLGVGSDKLGRFLRKNLGAFKLITTALFIALGAFLLSTL